MMSSGSTRIVILIVVTAVFAEVWSHDHRPEGHGGTAADQVHSLDQNPGIEPMFADDAKLAVLPVSVSQPIIRPPFRLPGYSFPVPGDIAPGMYRVIDGRGDVSTLVVTEANLSGRTASPTADHLVIRDAGRRWHFIRIEADAALELESAPRANVSRADVADAWCFVAREAWSRLQKPLEAARGPIRRWLRKDVEIGAAQRELH